MQTPAEKHTARAVRAHRVKQQDNLDLVAAGKLVVGYNGSWRCPQCGTVHPKSRRSVGCGCLGKKDG